jgi:hypothetical protein
MLKHQIKRAMAAAMIASTLLAGLAAAQPAHEDAAKEGKHGEDGGDASVSRSMDAPYLAVPVVRNGVLVNYLFVSVRIEINQGVDLWRTRERAQYLRDALVRACHANQLDEPNDVNALNQPRAIQVFHDTAVQVLGARTVGRVTIVASYSSRGSAT